MAILGFVGALCVIFAYRLGSAVVVAPMQYSQILWAVVYGYAFFGETPDSATAIGAAIIILSGIYVVFREETHRTSPRNRPVLAEPVALRQRHLPAHQLAPPPVQEGLTAAARAGPWRSMRARCAARPVPAVALSATSAVNTAACRSVAQPGSAPASGAGGRRFESSHSDQTSRPCPGSRPARVRKRGGPAGEASPCRRRPIRRPWLSIVVPLKNEAENLDFVTEAIAAACADLAPYEIVYVDDGSTDDTAARVLRAARALPDAAPGPACRPAPASRRRSTAASASPAGSAICTLDGDGQNPPAEIRKLVARLDGRRFPDGVALIAGQRVGRQDTASKRLASQRRQRHPRRAC